MLFWSLLQSTLPTTLRYRGAEALDARMKIVESFSFQLALEQWKIEVQELFERLLDTIQLQWRVWCWTFSARDVEHGLDYLDP